MMTAVVASGAAYRGAWGGWATFALGWVLFGAGGVLGVWGVVALGRNRTAFPRPLAGGGLVVTGPYARVRHPLYGSVLLASCGWGLIWASVPALVGAVALAGFLRAKAAHEERWLRETYAEYEAYARRVRRLIPWVW